MDKETVQEPALDKSEWPDGPWMTEPDRVQWTHAGYACLIVRSRMGQLCGYVGVPAEHPDFGQSYDSVDKEIDVHGGLTYANECAGAICHVPEPGLPDQVWWFGFDCAHAYDLVPRFVALEALHSLPNFTREDTYRDMSYVTRETERLAEQLRERASR